MRNVSRMSDIYFSVFSVTLISLCSASSNKRCVLHFKMTKMKVSPVTAIICLDGGSSIASSVAVQPMQGQPRPPVRRSLWVRCSALYAFRTFWNISDMLILETVQTNRAICSPYSM